MNNQNIEENKPEHRNNMLVLLKMKRPEVINGAMC